MVSLNNQPIIQVYLENLLAPNIVPSHFSNINVKSILRQAGPSSIPGTRHFFDACNDSTELEPKQSFHRTLNDESGFTCIILSRDLL